MMSIRIPSFGARSLLQCCALGLAATMLGACGPSTRYEPIAGNDAARSPRDGRSVEVRFTAPSERTYEEVGILTATASSTLEDRSERDFARELREMAAARGCDAIVIGDGTTHSPGLALLDHGPLPGRRGICLTYTDGKGPDRGALSRSNEWLDVSAPTERAVTISADPPPASCAALGSIQADSSHPSESVKRALLRRRAREKRANYVQLGAEGLSREHVQAAAFTCPEGTEIGGERASNDKGEAAPSGSR